MVGVIPVIEPRILEPTDISAEGQITKIYTCENFPLYGISFSNQLPCKLLYIELTEQLSERFVFDLDIVF